MATAQVETHKNFIGGQWQEASSGNTYTIYNPAKTRLLREAAEAGCKTISGVDMFVRQAADQFKAWTDQAAPVEVFREVLVRSLDQEELT